MENRYTVYVMIITDRRVAIYTVRTRKTVRARKSKGKGGYQDCPN